MPGFAQDTLPNLRFDSGDVIIKLSDSPSDWLLLHKDVIQAGCPVLGAAMQDCWKRAEAIKVPGTDLTIQVYKFALNFIDDTLLLSGRDFHMPDSNTSGTDFYTSLYAHDDWSKLHRCGKSPQKMLESTSRAHKCLFAILYDLPVKLQTITGETRTRESAGALGDDLNSIILLCAYADYYGCLGRVAPVLLDLLLGHPFVWQCVAFYPLKFIALAKRLRSVKLYFDALRHLIASGEWKEVSEIFHVSEEEMIDCSYPIIEEQGAIIDKLRIDLTAVNLTEFRTRYQGGSYTIRITFFNAIAEKLRVRSEYAKARERFNFMARSIYIQWLNQKLYGERVEHAFGKDKPCDAGGFNSACVWLLQAAQSNNPSKVFRYKTGARISSIFKLGRKYDSEKRIQKDLDDIVIEAAGIIQKAFETRQEEQEEGTVLTWRRCEYDAHGDYFTYLPVDEGNLPWTNEAPWEEASERPAASMAEASDTTLMMLGFVEDVKSKEDKVSGVQAAQAEGTGDMTAKGEATELEAIDEGGSEDDATRDEIAEGEGTGSYV